jgi:hypothetical protein
VVGVPAARVGENTTCLTLGVRVNPEARAGHTTSVQPCYKTQMCVRVYMFRRMPPFKKGQHDARSKPRSTQTVGCFGASQPPKLAMARFLMTCSHNIGDQK